MEVVALLETLFFSWAARCSSKTAEFHCIGTAPSLNRQTANDAFCKFLMLLRFPNNNDLIDLFNCEACTSKEGPDIRRMEAVVMDGTALGILGKLPDSSVRFQRFLL